MRRRFLRKAQTGRLHCRTGSRAGFSKELSIYMNRLFASLATLALGCSLTVAGQTPAVSPKVAVIAFQTAVTQTNEFQRDYADLEKKYEPKREQLKALNDEINTLTKQLQTQSAMLNDTQRIQREGAIQDKQKQAQRMAQDDQSDYQSDVQGMFTSMAAKVGEVMNTYAKDHGYTVVLNAGQSQNPTVIYANPTADITKAIIDAYNLKSGVPAPPSSASASQPAASRPAASRSASRSATRPTSRPATRRSTKPAAAGH